MTIYDKQSSDYTFIFSNDNELGTFFTLDDTQGFKNLSECDFVNIQVLSLQEVWQVTKVRSFIANLDIYNLKEEPLRKGLPGKIEYNLKEKHYEFVVEECGDDVYSPYLKESIPLQAVVMNQLRKNQIVELTYKDGTQTKFIFKISMTHSKFVYTAEFILKTKLIIQ